MLCQPTVLGFEVENLSEVHQGKEHNQPLMLIHEGMATMDASALGLHKALKQGPKKIDIVGEGWQSHQGTSWEMGVFPQRRPDLPTMSSLNAFVHTPHLIGSQGGGFVRFGGSRVDSLTQAVSSWSWVSSAPSRGEYPSICSP